MTERLYYYDSFVKEFDANVVSCERDGERWKVVLDRTAFYPTSGGQPHDLGFLGGAPVVEVTDAEEHVVHYTSAEVAVGPAHGRVEWRRRFDHMQQHTAQHLLSAAFIELYGIPTVSFHLGEEICTIDLKAESLSKQQMDASEHRTNDVIFEDRVVEVRFGTAEELASAGIRKSVDREGVLRAIRVEGFDFQPCGGTHLARTGQAGLVLLRGVERRRDSVRLEFVAGGRAVAAARKDFAILSEAASVLTCGLPEVPAGITKIAEDRRASVATLKKLEERLADLEAARLLAEPAAARDGGGSATRVVSAVLQDAAPTFLMLLASKIVASSTVPLIVVLAEQTSGHVAMAHTKGDANNVGAVLRELLAAVPGKGGGGKDFAQATLSNRAQAAEFVDQAKRLLAPAAT